MSYCCPEKTCQLVSLTATERGLTCPNGHLFPYAQGTSIPVFASTVENANEYSLEDAAIIHDNALAWLLATFGTDEPTLRRNLIGRLELKRGQRILVTGAGAGNDLEYIVQGLDGYGEIYAQDIAMPMLLSAAARHHRTLEQKGLRLFFSIGDAANLPFADEVFDSAYHFGGINLFPDVRRGIAEMNRVVKPGGKIVIGDEGLGAWLKERDYGRMLIENNRLYAFEPPLALLPETAREVKLSWELGNSFFVIEFRASRLPLPINIDIPHMGRRGGSIRKRYFGRLEGVDPELRDRLYAEAERLGISRVEFLEQIIGEALQNRQKRQ